VNKEKKKQIVCVQEKYQYYYIKGINWGHEKYLRVGILNTL